ncbi:MAG TPA: glycosyltransferase, partial [Chthoniobacterales bacterium]|nr:glycosyltransferase [Chthoniobacterales bacterium]
MRSYRPTSPEDLAARTQVSNQVLLWLDEPQDWNRKVRYLRLQGWIVPKRDEPFVAIRALLRGQVFEGAFDRDRPDVPKHVGIPDAPVKCGFTVDVRVPFGKGRLELQVARADGKWIKAFARDVHGPLRMSMVEQRQRADEQTRAHHPFFIDRPAEEEWTTPRRHLHVSGWCFAKNGDEIVELRGKVRGKTFPANYGILRPDVAASYDCGMAALRSGFSLDAKLPPGPATFVLEARGRSGTWTEVLTRPVRGALLRPRRVDEEEAVGNYAEWIRQYDQLTKRDRDAIAEHIRGFPSQPRFSILLPVYNTDERWLRRAIESVRAQFYPNWQLCAVDDASTQPHVGKVLEEYAARDPRIK